ncbi:MAG: serine/threonine protein kinase [Proteobacteria bacterium]|nr:serine/threonine protein kinase [Pseudomonadota bacterium]
MATVHEAYDHRLQVWRAVKTLHPDYAKRRKLRLRFLGEAQAMARLEHKNIVRVYDVGEDGNTVYIVMEIIRGGALEDWLEDNGQLPPRLAVRVLLDMCSGIQCAHDIGIIHRDIKPHNVLVDSKGVCKVTDFGIAQVKDTTGQMTRTGTVMGTLGFMAPEQRTDAKHIDERADVYSLGASLFTMITARTSMDLFASEQDDSIMADIGAQLKGVIGKATRYHPADRYASVDALAEALRELLPRLPADPPETAPLVRPARPIPPPPELPDSVDTTTFSTEMEEEPAIRQPHDQHGQVGQVAAQAERPQTATERLRAGFEDTMATGEQTTLHVRDAEHPDNLVAEEDPSLFGRIKDLVLRAVGLFLTYAVGEGFLARVLIPGAIIVVGMGIWLNLGAESVSIAQTLYQSTERDYLAHVYSDKDALAEKLLAAGVAHGIVQSNLDSLARAKTYQDQLEAAGRFVEAADSALLGVHTIDPTHKGRKAKARAQIEIMQQKQQSAMTAYDTWVDASEGSAASMAIRLRLAEAPPQ